MKNGFAAGVLAGILIASTIGSAGAITAKVQKELEYRDISVTLDGVKLDLKDAKGNPVEPFMFEGTNYLPVRALAESLGLNVAWDGSTNTVVLTSPKTTLDDQEILVGSKSHIRVYYTGLEKTTDGEYLINLRIENDSDYTVHIYNQGSVINNKYGPWSYVHDIEPGKTVDEPMVIPKDRASEIDEVDRVKIWLYATGSNENHEYIHETFVSDTIYLK